MVARVRGVVAVLLACVVVSCSGAAAPPRSAPVVSTSPAAGVLPWPALPATALPGELGVRLQAELARWIDKGFVPGATAAVVTPGGVWSGAAGVDGDQATLKPESAMALASITKTFTAAEVMLLAERGKIDLDRPASTYLSLAEVSNGVTVRQLLGHRSGIRDAGEDAYPDMFSKPNQHWSPQQVLAEVPTPTQPPNQTWEYANANFIVLGLLVKAVAGVDLPTAMPRDLWEPLALNRLAYQDAQALPPPLAAPGGDDGLPTSGTAAPYLPYRSLASAAGAAGGISGDALSVAKWGYDLYGARLLKPDSISQMTDFDDGDGYGLGTFDYTDDHWFRYGIDGFGHTGVIAGYRTVLAVYPAEDLSIAILTPSSVEPWSFVRYLKSALDPPNR